MGTLKLSDGTILENSYPAVNINNLFLYIGNGMDIVQLANLLTPERLSEITYEYGDDTNIYTGYIHIIGLSKGVNVVSVVLRQ